MKALSSLIAAALILSCAGTAGAGILTSDDFNYSGALTSNGWVAHSGAGNKVIMSNGSYATLDQSAGSGEDVSLVFPALGATDKVYAALDLNLPAADNGGITSVDGEGLYLTHFKNATTNFRGRTGVIAPTGGGDYGLAIHADSANLGAGVAWASDLSFDTWYRIVFSWDAATGQSQLWLNPTLETDPSISHTGTLTGDLIEGFALRQSSDYTGKNWIDNVVVGNTFNDVVPEPASMLLLGVGAAALIRRRR
ncbi:MAG: hypothetical protein CHACPFDD_00546 [Phycisphaerae bacterium]|nr:hypothetical protein [Phycisphaerae bacterium]